MRITVDLSAEAFEMLNQLVEKQKTTLAEAIDIAIATDYYFKREMAEGSKISILRRNGEVLEISRLPSAK